MSTKTKLTEELLRSVDGMTLREAAEKLGVGKSTVGDARKLRALNNGTLPGHEDDETEESLSETYGEDGKGSITVVVLEDLEPDDILRKFGRDPAKVRITGMLSESHWGSDEKGWKHSYKFATEKISADTEVVLDLPLLYQEVMDPFKQGPYVFDEWVETGRTNVVVWADPQTGKTDSRGGTPELIKRMAIAQERLAEWIAAHPADEAAFLSVGDEVESFENVPSQAFTNDLSFPQQLDLELTFEMEYIRTLAATHTRVQVAGTSSNHCAWRKGKDILGRPGDDYGLYLKRQLEKALRLSEAYDHVEFVYPDIWDETNAVTVSGTTKIALAHGHQANGPNGIVDWWKKQAFGRQASADADILLTGHFHHFRMEEVNNGGIDHKPRFWIQAPTMDNGSSWVRNKWGNDSSPGILVFQVDSNGLVLGSLEIL